MYKLSDAFDLTDKVMEIYNFYIEDQKQKLIAEIEWLGENEENIDVLRSYLATQYNQYLVLQLDGTNLRQLAEMHGNALNVRLHQLCQQKTDTRPLKVIVQELKYFGR